MEEIWRDISSNKNYQVSNFGEVRSKRRIVEVPDRYGGKFLRDTPSVNLKKIETFQGYLRATLSSPGSRPAQWFVHRLVAIEFCIGKTELRNQVNHKDGNRKNNKAENLEWVSASENHLHAYRVLGRKPYDRKKKRNQPGKQDHEIRT